MCVRLLFKLLFRTIENLLTHGQIMWHVDETIKQNRPTNNYYDRCFAFLNGRKSHLLTQNIHKTHTHTAWQNNCEFPNTFDGVRRSTLFSPQQIEIIITLVQQTVTSIFFTWSLVSRSKCFVIRLNVIGGNRPIGCIEIRFDACWMVWLLAL